MHLAMTGLPNIVIWFNIPLTITDTFTLNAQAFTWCEPDILATDQWSVSLYPRTKYMIIVSSTLCSCVRAISISLACSFWRLICISTSFMNCILPKSQHRKGHSLKMFWEVMPNGKQLTRWKGDSAGSTQNNTTPQILGRDIDGIEK